jgi:hypothetical protein
MKNENILELIFGGVLAIMALIHIYTHSWKHLKAALLVILLSFLPTCLNSFFHIKVDTFSGILYYAILFMTLYLGSSSHYYDKYSWWDRLVHFLSGVSFVGFGIAIAALNPAILRGGILLFSYTFSITLHAIWEIMEYSTDCLTHGNVQRWQKRHDSNNHVSEKAIQPAGLVDTMNDLICCMSGAGLAIVVWWFTL